ncbi:periplasmic polyamine-binding protein [Rippkaea orientalis PCC 8801]|uniref:Periplasmic polyamine-binding protein n=1 Tax=Rippkaea orientalis (strain PCC 8801 / RF-1) TaxID=41431 RepID=B7JYD0_RIPO1|nr:extracellular solute-binding protein [Rippkaea orientalis]ACK67232.1 periplasmic polyamine-binding protein [Rippkaea orientalis PCC 8801]
MLSRRSFLISTSILTLGQLLSGCGDGQTALRIFLLQGSIPPQLLTAFRQKLAQNAPVSFKVESQLKDLWKRLESWQQGSKDSQGLKNLVGQLPLINPNTSEKVDLVTLGDAWLAQAIQAELIEPLPLEVIPTWSKLPSRWQGLVKRDSKGNLSPQGQIWGAPYRWGTTLIAYDSHRFEKLGWTPKDWSDLWREELRDRIALVDQPREVIGLTLKKLGYSYNTTDLSQVSSLTSELLALHKQVKYYSSDHYLQPLVVGDAWLSVGWSSDIIPLVNSNRNIKAVVPASGTALWSDVWVNPKVKQGETKLSELTKQWLDFCWQDQAVNQICLLTDGVSPMIYQAKELPSEVKDNPLLFIDQRIMDKCDFIEPLPLKVKQEYETLWKTMRTSTND